MSKTQNKRLKLFNLDIKSVDEEKRQITFCFSDDKEDRQGEVVDQASWQTDNYMANPVILWGHDPSEPENVLGQGVKLDLNNNGRSYITAQFDDDDVNPRAGMIFKQLLRRTLRCVSAGFINHSWEVEEDVPILRDNELLEVSIVPIPANPRAIALALKDGGLTTKDARWMMDSMRKEADQLEAQLKHDNNESGESMDELKTQIAALTDTIGKIAESVNSVSEQNAAIVAKFEADEAARAEAEKQATEKAEADAKAAAEKEAADKAEADKKAAEEKAEAERVAAEEAEKKRLEEEEAAKGGSDDQPGADTDEFDEDAELTDEEKAQIDRELEEALAN
ncbi:HK97 family phage prohead protease [Williamsia sterculiae]|uniref:Phage prohead protease, HK97 family n=1 Tax=Williamsia sterculiae TaxID=1344003 RepID=A0A1N7GFQ5_9NOCA|nr:HK97 family phage prohead protease [Williamsia sterculiae]SIS11445.1 phage prohead protease, HK97 family [Williamsia sterculiae]